MSPSNQFSQNDCGPIDPAKSPKTKGCYVLKCDPFLAYKHCLLCLFLSLCSPSQGLAPSISLSLSIFLSLFLYLSLSLSLSLPLLLLSLCRSLSYTHRHRHIPTHLTPTCTITLCQSITVWGSRRQNTEEEEEEDIEEFSRH